MSQSASVTHPIPPTITGHDGDSRERRDGWRAETVITQWDLELQLVGALMHLPAGKAAPILNLVPDTAIRRPMTRWAVELIRSLVDEGRDPDPVTVLHRAKHQPAAQALHPDQPPTAEQHHGLAVHLASLYTHTVSPDAATSPARDVPRQRLPAGVPRPRHTHAIPRRKRRQSRGSHRPIHSHPRGSGRPVAPRPRREPQPDAHPVSKPWPHLGSHRADLGMTSPDEPSAFGAPRAESAKNDAPPANHAASPVTYH
jgi:hypothetical protein